MKASILCGQAVYSKYGSIMFNLLDNTISVECDREHCPKGKRCTTYLTDGTRTFKLKTTTEAIEEEL